MTTRVASDGTTWNSEGKMGSGAPASARHTGERPAPKRGSSGISGGLASSIELRAAEFLPR